MTDIILQGWLLGMKQMGFEFVKYGESSKIAYFSNPKNVSKEFIDLAKIIF